MPEPIAGNTLFLRSGRVSWADLRERGCPIAAQLASAQVRRLAWVADGQDEAMLAAAAMIACDLSGAILTPDRLTEPLRVRLAETGMPLFRDGQIQVDRAARTGATAEAGLEARIWVLSSGSTGTPKLAEHSWRTLYTARAAQSTPGTIWICPYLPGTYAWYQLGTRGLCGAGQRRPRREAGRDQMAGGEPDQPERAQRHGQHAGGARAVAAYDDAGVAGYQRRRGVDGADLVADPVRRDAEGDDGLRRQRRQREHGERRQHLHRRDQRQQRRQALRAPRGAGAYSAVASRGAKGSTGGSTEG